MKPLHSSTPRTLPQDRHKILLVNITRLGDMLQASPTIAGMKKANPDAHVTVIVEKQFEFICHCIPHIDAVKTIDLAMVVQSLSREGEGIVDAYDYLDSFIKDLREQEYDYCLNMSSSAYTALLLSLVGVRENGGWTSDVEGNRRIESTWARLFATSVFHQNRQYNSINLVDVFRCSADVVTHPHHLLMNVEDEALQFAKNFLDVEQLPSTGPVIALQAGASQLKRQWGVDRFAVLIKMLIAQLGARVVLIGSGKERRLIETIVERSEESQVVIAAGETSLPQLGALLSLADILITGDTGPMHVAASVRTPVISLFVASAFGFETGPYGADHVVLQPVIGCGPCNPNKACSQPDCHQTISPELLVALTALRLKGPITALDEVARSHSGSVRVYTTFFDDHGFYDMVQLNVEGLVDPYAVYRRAYRALWLEELAGVAASSPVSLREGVAVPDAEATSSSHPLLILPQVSQDQQSLHMLQELVCVADRGSATVQDLISAIGDASISANRLGMLTDMLGSIDKEIEHLGYQYPFFGPVTRMFIFDKENLAGTEAAELASEMGEVYLALSRRATKLRSFLSTK